MEPAETLPEPTQQLAPAARALWRTTGVIWSLGLFVATAMAANGLGDWDERPAFVTPGLWLGALIASVVLVVVVPEVRWRRWRYEIREREIDIRHGLWTVRRTLVPMARVQHVDTESGLVQQGFDLSTVVFHTAAGQTAIPQLSDDDAAAARERIAQLAQVGDDGV